MASLRAAGSGKAQVLAQFNSRENIRYLSQLLKRDVADEVMRFSRKAQEILDSSVLRRGPVSMWDEVKRLNKEFYQSQKTANAPSSESYAMRMFEADSLRPAGLEHLNDEPARGMYGGEDEPWSAGDASRSAEQALAEYWGESLSESHLHVVGDGAAYGGPMDRGFNGRFKRPHPPFWQKGGREGYERDISETLGNSPSELNGQVRGWDMSRMTAASDRRSSKVGRKKIAM